MSKNPNILIDNRKARFEYFLEEDYTEDILQEINRKGLQNATNAHMRR